MNVIFMLASLFCVLFITTHFANKYVLSELRFTYPTIFQGWQTLVGVVMFKALISTGHVENLLQGKEWHDCALWLPGMMSFLISIYSGSRALANLPIPVFFVMQNLTLVFRATYNLVFHRQILSVYSYLMLMLSVSSAVAVAKTDPQYDPDGYFWMCVHVVSLGFFDIYTSVMKGRLKLRATERLFCCYFYSFLVLAPCSYFLGDALEAARFPYLYFTKFYLGCILSGVLGMLLNVCAIRIDELRSVQSLMNVNTIQSVAKILCSCASLSFYDMKMTHSFICFIAINLVCCVGFYESTSHRRTQLLPINYSRRNDDQSSLESSILSVDGSQKLKRHELQQDMIHADLI
ncbi:unnamed protein product [Candidula unifasciata]|uniref:Transmembrane protein 241 n=1 Tax=Candidula unifasciata TaxID=100452 RepID=A0A8S3Z4Q1_9EUPU|nr:unnamed protein product [Candidula unifasciata]